MGKNSIGFVEIFNTLYFSMVIGSITKTIVYRWIFILTWGSSWTRGWNDREMGRGECGLSIVTKEGTICVYKVLVRRK
jgi:hypothetical protein